MCASINWIQKSRNIYDAEYKDNDKNFGTVHTNKKYGPLIVYLAIFSNFSQNYNLKKPAAFELAAKMNKILI